MKTSARNQLRGTVAAIRRGAINDEIELELSGGAHIVAVITHESTEHLGLKPGVEAIALIKAPWIVLATDIGGMKLSTRNCLDCSVFALHHGAVNTEVQLTFGQGSRLVAMITNDSVQELGLQAGSAVTALFKASHVILAVGQS